MSIKSGTFYFAVCDGCGSEYQYEDETFLYDTADHLERAVRNDWTERDGKHYCNDCCAPEEPAPPSLPLFPDEAAS